MTDNEILHRLKEVNAKQYGTDDLDSARLFSDVFSECVYNQTSKTWNYFDGKRIIADYEGLHALQNAKQLAKVLPIYYSSVDASEKEKAEYFKYCAKWQQSGFRQRVVTDAKSNNFINNEMLDSDRYILNVENGALKIEKDGFEFIPHGIDLMCSKMANVTYDQDAQSKEWLSFLDEIMQGDKEKIRYLQKVLGLCLTGNTENEQMYFFYGASTRNGKSTLVETMCSLLGDYAQVIKPESLCQKSFQDGARASNDIAKLRGCRLLSVSEFKRGSLLDVPLVKQMTGNDSLTARFCFEREFTFKPTFKVICNTNFLPIATDNTLFSSNRAVVVGFNRHFKPHEIDTGLKARLTRKNELSGILNWLLSGYGMYLREGLQAPESIVRETEQYQHDSDKIQLFIDDRLEESESNMKATVAFDQFVNWCKVCNLGIDSKRSFFAELKSKGLLRASGTVCGKTEHNVIMGYTVKEEFAGIG